MRLSQHKIDLGAVIRLIEEGATAGERNAAKRAYKRLTGVKYRRGSTYNTSGHTSEPPPKRPRWWQRKQADPPPAHEYQDIAHPWERSYEKAEYQPSEYADYDAAAGGHEPW